MSDSAAHRGFIVVDDPLADMLDILSSPEPEREARLRARAEHVKKETEQFADRWVDQRFGAPSLEF